MVSGTAASVRSWVLQPLDERQQSLCSYQTCHMYLEKVHFILFHHFIYVTVITVPVIAVHTVLKGFSTGYRLKLSYFNNH